MPRWVAQVKVKHLFDEREDHVSVQENMNAIADVLSQSVHFLGFDVSLFRQIPKGDAFFRPVDYANKLLSKMYDFADSHSIWLE